MVSATHGQPVLICERREIVWMRGLHHETNKRATVLTWSENTHSRQFSQTFHRITSKMRIMFENCRAADPLDVINRGGEPDRAGDVRCARLKSVGRFLERAFFQGDADDHLPAAMPWGNGIENIGPPVKRPDASRSAHFVSGESEEIAAQLADIDRQMSYALGRIHQRERADRPRFVTKLGNRIDRSEGI